MPHPRALPARAANRQVGTLHLGVKAMTTRTEHFPHITSDPAIQGGAAVVAGMRLPVRAVACGWRETHDRKRILRNPKPRHQFLDMYVQSEW